MRINLNKRGVTAGLLVVLTVLSLVFLLFGGDDSGSRKDVRPGEREEARAAAGLVSLSAGSAMAVMPFAPVKSFPPAEPVAATGASLPASAISSAPVYVSPTGAPPVTESNGPSVPVSDSSAATAPAISTSDSPVAHSQPSHTTRQPLAVPPAASEHSGGQPTLGRVARKAAALAEIFGQSLQSIVDANRQGRADASDGATPGQANVARGTRGGSPLVSPDGHVFEENLAPGLADHVVQADFALAQSLRRLNLPDNRLLIDSDELRDEHGAYYHHKTIRIYAGDDLFLYQRTLRESLLSWAETARLEPAVAVPPGAQTGPGKRPEGGVWNIILEGVVTHTLYIYAGSAPEGGSVVEPPGMTHTGAPRMVIVLDDLGESMRHAKFLLGLRYPVTFAIWPRSSHAAEVAQLAQRGGAEIIIHQPMQPVAYPEVKPGPGAMLESMSDAELLEMLDRNLSIVPQAVGLNNHMGSLLTQNERAMRLVSGELRQRGLLALDSLTHARSVFGRVAAAQGVTTYRRDIFLDVDPDKEAVLAQLRKAERIALLKGQSIAIGHPLPGTLEALNEWQTQRNPQVQLVKLSDLVPLKR